ncbi:2OG-Fe(II) oxygenase superfamily protein [Pseudomonas sp. NFPP07]|uniref:2OG-Fe(II) oxygenase n=1 Tax=Pseudomonas sp. NFPP07 TaxID=1566213 RepID=UPI0008E046EA|nr:2OG-Fe(II) oxygenase [Pseudomonas sp. NFPP07]SFQ82468.1 2OG-Fe(II) oxygenase superfamily protein [Pseudomonas sp. NFPP07]
MLIVDNFLPEFEALREYADCAEFKNVVNDFDGVTYPLICRDIPPQIAKSVLTKLSHIVGSEVLNPTMFMRRSPAGIHCPHQVHSDLSMGHKSLMLYLNREEDCRGGTSFLSHKDTGIGYNPGHPTFVSLVVASQNDPDAWDVRDMAEMRPNRAVIFDAARLHRAEPVGGFGDTPENTRVVLTCFFS